MKHIRSIEELRKVLKREISLLKDYYFKAFREGDKRYLGEIACKIRLLACKTKSNKPLLIGLINEDSIEIPIEINKPGGVQRLELKDYITSLSSVHRNKEGRLVEYSKRELVLLFAQKLGGCHVDWTLSEDIVNMLQVPIQLGGVGPIELQLKGICKTVIIAGEKYLNQVEFN